MDGCQVVYEGKFALLEKEINDVLVIYEEDVLYMSFCTSIPSKWPFLVYVLPYAKYIWPTDNNTASTSVQVK